MKDLFKRNSVNEQFYIIRLIKKGSKPYEIREPEEEYPDWKDKHFPLFNEFYTTSDMSIYVFDSNKKFMWSTKQDSILYHPIYDDVKKMVNEYDIYEIMIEESQLILYGDIRDCEEGIQSKTGKIDPMSDFSINILWNLTFSMFEENTTIINPT